jgi:hypothetical protein
MVQTEEVLDEQRSNGVRIYVAWDNAKTKHDDEIETAGGVRLDDRFC